MTRFLAARPDTDGVRVALLGAPWDGTVSYRGGARFGPIRIREASHSLETYSLRLDTSLDHLAFADAGDLEVPFGAPETAVRAVEAGVRALAERGVVPLLLGGEHLLSLGAVRALAGLRPPGGLAVVQFDAHADLRDDYLGERLSHATVMRRVAEVVGPENVWCIGIRSGSAAEIRWGRAHVRWLDGPVDEAAQRAAQLLRGKAIYVTLDIDVLDPSVAPGTGNPEPGGVGFDTLLLALDALRECRVVGADLVEVAPPLDPSGRTEIVGAALVRHMLLSWFA